MRDVETKSIAPVSAESISVIVPARAASDTLGRCLHALASAVPPAGEIIVVADGPDPALRPLVESVGATLLELPERQGAPVARNAGAAKARGAVLLFVDADVVIAADVVAQVVTALNDCPEWCAVFGSYDDAPGARNFVAQYKGLLNHHVHQRGAVEASTFWTAMGAIRRDVFMAMDGFNPAQRLEDIELGYRLRAAGYRIGLRRTMLATHLKKWSAMSVLRSDFFDRALPWTELLLTYRRTDNDLNLDWRNRVSVLCVGTLGLAMLLAWKLPIAAAAMALGAAGMLLILNAELYRFFLAKRGVRFCLAAIPWHWLYFLYGGVGFAWGTCRYAKRRSHVKSPSHAAS